MASDPERTKNSEKHLLSTIFDQKASMKASANGFSNRISVIFAHISGWQPYSWFCRLTGRMSGTHRMLCRTRAFDDWRSEWFECVSWDIPPG